VNAYLGHLSPRQDVRPTPQAYAHDLRNFFEWAAGATSISGAWAWRTSRSSSPGCSDRVQRVNLLCTSCRARRPRSISPRSYARPGGQGRDDQRHSRRLDLGRKAVRRLCDTNLDEPAGLRPRPPPQWCAGAVQGIPQRAPHRDTRSGQRHPPVPGDPRTRISRQPPGRPETPRRPAGGNRRVRPCVTGAAYCCWSGSVGLALPWSSGIVEGHVNRVKTFKRAICGRASCELLRTRILTQP
jgi:hypothetical protein